MNFMINFIKQHCFISYKFFITIFYNPKMGNTIDNCANETQRLTMLVQDNKFKLIEMKH